MTTPSTNGVIGHDAQGRFIKNNCGGPGNPYNQRVAALRSMLLAAVTEDDLQSVVTKLIAMAKGGDLAAIRELLDRTLGKSPAAVAVGVVEDGSRFLSSVPEFTTEQRERFIDIIMRRIGPCDD